MNYYLLDRKEVEKKIKMNPGKNQFWALNIVG
jgi:hypothetical protein